MGQLTAAQQRKVQERLEGVWPKPRPCPVCGSDAIWCVSGNLLGMQAFDEGMLLPGAPITVLVAVRCQRCNHVMLFNAITLCVVDQYGHVVE